MSYIIQIETATTSCSIALAKDGLVLGIRQIDQRNIHAEVITIFIEELVKAAGLSYGDLDAVAVSCGPGSYTGLRIGVSTAKGLCFALDKPLIAVDTLTAMASGIISSNGVEIAGNTLLCPMIDARRMEVYTALFDHRGEMIRPVSADIIDEQSFAEYLRECKVIFFGDGAEKCRAVLGGHENAIFFPGFVNSAAFMTGIAIEKFARSEFEDVAYFEPYYLKEFIAGKKVL